MREIPPSQTLMPGLHFEGGQRWKITADSLRVLQGALGCELLNALVRCLAAVDRLFTILDCVSLNKKHLGVDSVRGERNLNALGLFAVGIVHEFREGLHQLALLPESDVRA